MGNLLPEKQRHGNKADMLDGDIHLDANANCNFGPFRPPQYASPETIKIESWDSKYELLFQFTRNGYLKLRVSREMVFMNPYAEDPSMPPPGTPEVFVFVGIWRDREKENAERQEIPKARRPPPCETWFEMNHPMGWRHQSQYC